MSTRINAPRAPVTAGDLLGRLGRVRLLDDGQRRRLSAGWPDDLPARDAAAQLVAAGLLTPYQAEQALAGRARRLRVGPYLLRDRLGAGSGGEVFAAEHVLMKRLVTLKVFAKGAGRPRDEVAAAAKLAHPNLAAALHADRFRGRLVLALEYVDGVDLECLMQQAGPLPVELAREVVRQAAEALRHLHGRGLLHHDVKPANLLLAHQAAGPVVKLIDLGLAPPIGDAGELSGTVDYLAPERAAGGPVDRRSDLYSLGCTAYHLLAGRPPFPGGAWTEKLVRHGTEAPPPLRSLRPEVPAPLAAVVAKLMERDPERRYPDAAALLAELETRPKAVAPPAPPPRRRGGRLRAALGRVLVAVLLGCCAGGAVRVAVSAGGRGGAAVERNVITVGGRDGEFVDLQKAIDAAPDGGVVTLTGPGPYRVAPVRCQGKSLTIRAAEGARALVEREGAESSAWDPLIWGDQEVRLIGLDLAGGEEAAPLASVEGGSLALTDCTLRGHGPGPLVTLRKGTALRLERARLEAQAQGVAVEVGAAATEVTLSDANVKVRSIDGAALLLWSPESSRGSVAVRLRRAEADAGRIIALRGLGGRVDVEASSCRFRFVRALVSIDGCRDRGDWRAHLRWRAMDVTHATSGPYLRHDGRAVAWDEAAWAKLGR